MARREKLVMFHAANASQTQKSHPPEWQAKQAFAPPDGPSISCGEVGETPGPPASASPRKQTGARGAPRRLKLEIGAFGYNQHRWTPAEDKLLERFSTKEVAQRLGLHPSSVAARRERTGLVSRNPLRRPWTPGQTALLGTMPDAEAAR